MAGRDISQFVLNLLRELEGRWIELVVGWLVWLVGWLVGWLTSCHWSEQKTTLHGLSCAAPDVSRICGGLHGSRVLMMCHSYSCELDTYEYEGRSFMGAVDKHLLVIAVVVLLISHPL
jgi:hypothetical protein